MTGIAHVGGIAEPVAFHRVQRIFDAPAPQKSWTVKDAASRVAVMARDINTGDLKARLDPFHISGRLSYGRLLPSPWLGHAWRFQPSSSAYAIKAPETHGVLRGLWLTLHRLARCNPWGRSGYNPVFRARCREIKT